jgi:hypothetical protein
MNFPTITVLLALSTIVPNMKAWADDETPKVKTFRCGPVFRKPGFRTIDEFVEDVRARNDPWRELLMPDTIPEYFDREKFLAPLSDGMEVIHRSKETALVYAHNRPYGRSPFCSVIFLVEKKGHRFHVTDFIRRSVGYESYSDTEVPKVLKLEPRRFVHFYFAEDLGGRKWGFGTDEFFAVRNHRFQQTLLLKDDDAYLSPVDPYREFSQTAEVSVTRGRPCIRVQRSWTTADGEEPKENFSVLFHWNSHTQKFTSARAGKLQLAKGKLWSAESLPKPPPQP